VNRVYGIGLAGMLLLAGGSFFLGASMESEKWESLQKELEEKRKLVEVQQEELQKQAARLTELNQGNQTAEPKGQEAAGAADKPQTPAEPPKENAPAQEAPKQEAAVIDYSGAMALKKWYTVYGKSVKPAAGKNFLLVEVHLTNGKNDKMPYDAAEFQVKDRSGALLAADPNGKAIVEEEGLPWLGKGELERGGKRVGYVCFQIPQGESAPTMVWKGNEKVMQMQ
jgi:hypothetical protein